jgi:ABC-type polysaccharide/polyol phosphate transport system ATPase subunit
MHQYRLCIAVMHILVGDQWYSAGDETFTSRMYRRIQQVARPLEIIVVRTRAKKTCRAMMHRPA